MIEHSKVQMNKINKEFLYRGLKIDDVVIFYEIFDRLQGGAGIVSTKQLASNIKITEERIKRSVSRLVDTKILSTQRMPDPKSKDKYIRRYIKILWNPYLNNHTCHHEDGKSYKGEIIYIAAQSGLAFIKCLKNIIYQIKQVDNSLIFTLKPGTKLQFVADLCLKDVKKNFC